MLRTATEILTLENSLIHLGWSFCSFHLIEHYFSALNDVQVIDCLFAVAAAAADAKCLRYGKMLCSLIAGTLLHIYTQYKIL